MTEPFRFAPAPGPTLYGPSFSRTFKSIATLIVGGAAGWFVLLALDGKAQGGAVSILAWFLAAMAMMFYTWWCIVRGVTRLDAQALEQTWMWKKRMDLRDLATARVLRIRGLEWLIAPRVYARNLAGKFAVFHCADPVVLGECERMAGELRAFRALR